MTIVQLGAALLQERLNDCEKCRTRLCYDVASFRRLLQYLFNSFVVTITFEQRNS